MYSNANVNNIGRYNVKETTTQFIVEKKNFFAVKKITLTKQVRKDDRQEKSIYSFSKLFCTRMTNRWMMFVTTLSSFCHEAIVREKRLNGIASPEYLLTTT